MAQRSIVLASNTNVNGVLWAAGTYTIKDDKTAEELISAGATMGVVATGSTVAGLNKDVTYTAKTKGAPGNSVAVFYVDPGVLAALSISVKGKTITVSLENNAVPVLISTADAVIAAVNADPDASALVTAARKSGQNGTGVCTASGPGLLTGGVDEAPPSQYNAVKGAWEYTA